jgi:hypothetical protein
MTDTGSLNIEPGAVTAMLEGFPIAGSLRWQRKSADSINWTVDGQLKSRYLPLNCIFQDCWKVHGKVVKIIGRLRWPYAPSCSIPEFRSFRDVALRIFIRASSCIPSRIQ